MTTRTDPTAHGLGAMQKLIAFATDIGKQGLEPGLKHLVKIRASQMNGCVRCLHMHVLEARKDGETDERLFMLPAWRESALYTPRERAALAWTEALVRLHETGAPDADYALVAEQFTEEEQVLLTMTVAIINGFNAFGVGFRLAPMQPWREAA
jgi:AhpD family alkylhydroperoxidase